MLSLNSLLKSQMQMSTRQFAEMFPPRKKSELIIHCYISASLNIAVLVKKMALRI